ncbi:MAG: hypothetical protein ACFFG0_24425 [Candidatus Thorarchaeota archaeon]
MKLEDVEKRIGTMCIINGYGDLAMDGELKPFIRERIPVKIIKKVKSGLIQVELTPGKFRSVPQKNLSPIPEKTKKI